MLLNWIPRKMNVPNELENVANWNGKCLENGKNVCAQSHIHTNKPTNRMSIKNEFSVSFRKTHFRLKVPWQRVQSHFYLFVRWKTFMKSFWFLIKHLKCKLTQQLVMKCSTLCTLAHKRKSLSTAVRNSNSTTSKAKNQTYQCNHIEGVMCLGNRRKRQKRRVKHF